MYAVANEYSKRENRRINNKIASGHNFCFIKINMFSGGTNTNVKRTREPQTIDWILLQVLCILNQCNK